MKHYKLLPHASINYYKDHFMDRLEESEEKRKSSIHYNTTEDIFSLIYKSNINAVKTQIDSGVQVDCRNGRGQTLLHYALLYNQVGIAAFLISRGADVNVEDNQGVKVRNIIQERFPNLLSNTYISDVMKEQALLEETQVKNLGESDSYCDDCCCIM